MKFVRPKDTVVFCGIHLRRHHLIVALLVGFGLLLLGDLFHRALADRCGECVLAPTLERLYALLEKDTEF